jgi:DNA-binding transcriptional regulator YiaG
MNKIQVAKWVQDLKKESGLTIPEFARKIGVPYRTVEDWLFGQKKPTASSIALLKRVAEDIANGTF